MTLVSRADITPFEPLEPTGGRYVRTDRSIRRGRPSVWFWREDGSISDRVHVLTREGANAGFTALIEVSGDLSATDPIDADGVNLRGTRAGASFSAPTDWQ